MSVIKYCLLTYWNKIWRLISMVVTLPGFLVHLLLFLRAETQGFRLTGYVIYILYGCLISYIHVWHRQADLLAGYRIDDRWIPITRTEGHLQLSFHLHLLQLPCTFPVQTGVFLEGFISRCFGSHRIGIGPVCTETYWAMYHMRFTMMNQLCLIFLQTYFNIFCIILWQQTYMLVITNIKTYFHLEIIITDMIDADWRTYVQKKNETFVRGITSLLSLLLLLSIYYDN